MSQVTDKFRGAALLSDPAIQLTSSRFLSDDPRLCYSIREQICVGVWPNPKGFESRDFSQNLYVKSRCIDASKSWTRSH